MRIAFFAESFLPKWDGVTNTLCYLLEHLAARGHASLMFAPKGAPARYAETRVVGLSGFSFPLYPELKLAYPFIDVQQHLADFEPDLVHLVNPALMAWTGLRHTRSLDLPIVASYHTDIPGYASLYGWGLLMNPIWSYFRWLHNKADLNLCPSHFTRAQLQARGFERVKVWGRGVDTARFNPRYRSADWRLRLSGGEPESPLLLYVGRLALEKRVDWLRLLLDALPNVRLAIVGDGPLRDELAQTFADTPTVFTGYLQGEDLSHAYASADLFVFPSANETFGNVVLEAMASGLPVLAPRSGGPVDHVFDGENGFLFESDDLQDMIAWARRLVSNPAYVRRLGIKACAYAESQSWPRILDGLLEKYASLLDDPIGSRWWGARQLDANMSLRSEATECVPHS